MDISHWVEWLTSSLSSTSRVVWRYGGGGVVWHACPWTRISRGYKSLDGMEGWVQVNTREWGRGGWYRWHSVLDMINAAGSHACVLLLYGCLLGARRTAVSDWWNRPYSRPIPSHARGHSYLRRSSAAAAAAAACRAYTDLAQPTVQCALDTN